MHCCTVHPATSHCTSLLILKFSTFRGIASKIVYRFRCCYGEISQLRSLPQKPIPVALTATATYKVTKEIIQNLELQQPTRIVSMPERPNVYYDIVKIAESSIKNTFSWLVIRLDETKLECPRHMIFCRRHSHVHQLYAFFDKELGGKFDETSRPYEMFHGSNEDAMKTNITKSFAKQDGNVRVIFATIAFWMGLDCKNLHQVIHYGPPNSVVTYAKRLGDVQEMELKAMPHW